ncbi:phosphotransferase [Sulfoacidibacillus thermotolerans]|uniref:Aminoglycoside phosphotransferase domain-containing protein n=1 Tax=Sulfoacidibacillus thermotolerans TaxID=1765684 RepID=A0A2U3DC75_SULT2|nr:phosphotransferase [Sulfoacidibacillus thermotolerans]PWI58845.1 hypothetical protein BM613_01785 [Sulfoacidibacillus thermotolerans]
MDYESILHAVIPHYPMRVYDWKWTTPNSCLLITTYGHKLLRVDHNSARAVLRGQVLDALAQRGVRRVPRHIRTIYGDSEVRLDGYICTVSDQLRDRDIELPKDALAAIYNLSVLHEALHDCTSEAHTAPKHTHVSEVMIHGLNVLAQIEETCRREPLTPFAHLLIPNLSAVRERAHRNFHYAKAAGLLERATQLSPQLILGRYEPQSVAFTDLGRLATIDFDEIGMGDWEMDVMSFCRSLYVRGFSKEIERVLLEYGKHRSTDADWQQRIVSVTSFPFYVIRIAQHYLASEHHFEPVWRERLLQALTGDSGKA